MHRFWNRLSVWPTAKGLSLVKSLSIEKSVFGKKQTFRGGSSKSLDVYMFKSPKCLTETHC